MNAIKGQVDVSVRLRGGNAHANFETLMKSRASIEEELGERLIWRPSPQGKNLLISACLDDVDFRSPTGQAAALDWQVEKLRDFVEAFGPRIRKLAAYQRRSDELSEIRQAQLEYWTLFADRLREETDLESVHSPRPQHWFEVRLGRSGVHISNVLWFQKNSVGVEVYFRGSKGDRILQELLPDREAIEREIGARLEWNPRPERKDKVVILDQAANLADRDEWPNVLDWMVDMTERFREAFGPRVARGKLD